MVLQKRLDYGFNGYQVPPTPLAARSARRRYSFRKKVDDNQMCAFDLLATIAGKILLEGEGSPSSCDILPGNELCPTAKGFIKKEEQVEENLLKVEPCDQGSCDRSFFISELVSQVPVLEHSSKEFSRACDNDCCGLASVITSDCSEKAVSAEKLINDKSKIRLGSFSSKVEVVSSGHQESCDCTLEENKKQIKIEVTKTGKLSNSTKADICSLDDRAVRDRKPPVVSVDNSMTLPLCPNHVSRGSFPASWDDVKLVIRDDDENSSLCTQPSTTTMPFRSRPCIGDRKIRKRLTSKYWKVTPKLKHDEHFNASSKTYHNRKICYKRQRSQRDYPFKKKKLYDHSSVSNSDRGTSSKDMTTFPWKGFSCDAPGLGATMNGASGTSARAAGHYTKFQSKDSHASGTAARVTGHYTKSQSKDSHVKFRIKSFRVPELFIEIPESATVGSLKRRVMEAVTTILGGGLRVAVRLQGKKIRGLRVAVRLQGKKIRDDEKTLLQTGICHDNKLDACHKLPLLCVMKIVPFCSLPTHLLH